MTIFVDASFNELYKDRPSFAHDPRKREIRLSIESGADAEMQMSSSDKPFEKSLNNNSRMRCTRSL